MVTIGINGFGRIGRLAFRIIVSSHLDEIKIGAINTSGSMPVSGWAQLTNYDTMYRKYEHDVIGDESSKTEEVVGNLKISERNIDIPILAQKDPSLIPWSKYGVDLVIESTGKFTTEEDARKHAVGGAKRVIISAPSKGGNVGTYVLGVNENPSTGSGLRDAVVISNASCTTNCAAPVAAILNDAFGVEKAMMTTIHSYTDDQNLQDSSHKDLRRARAAGQNIIPTTTGAAIAVTETIPALKGLFDGMSLRVPITTGSITDFTFLLKKRVTKEEVNDAFKKAFENPIYKGIVAISEGALVSSDIIGRSESAIIDLPLTQVVDGNMVKVFAWYDNEWGYANRLVEQVIRVGRAIEHNNLPTDPITQTNKI